MNLVIDDMTTCNKGIPMDNENTAPAVEVNYPVGDTSVVIVDGDDLRRWLRWQYHAQRLLPYPQVHTAHEMLNRVAQLLGLADFNEIS